MPLLHVETANLNYPIKQQATLRYLFISHNLFILHWSMTWWFTQQWPWPRAHYPCNLHNPYHPNIIQTAQFLMTCLSIGLARTVYKYNDSSWQVVLILQVTKMGRGMQLPQKFVAERTNCKELHARFWLGWIVCWNALWPQVPGPPAPQRPPRLPFLPTLCKGTSSHACSGACALK